MKNVRNRQIACRARKNPKHNAADSGPIWLCRGGSLRCGLRPLIMGILNVTPDSFSDGGRYFTGDKAVRRGLKMIGEGAVIVDVGGESTRPGAGAVSADEESRRVVPVIERLCEQICRRKADGRCARDVLVSVDTMKAVVARRAIAAGAGIINDVSALTGDRRMIDVAGETGAGVVLMHMLGNPRVMQKHPKYDNVAVEVARYLGGRLKAAVRQGLDYERLAVDPGIGFGKTLKHNLELLVGLHMLRMFHRPVVVGVSRKSFLGRITGEPAGRRVAASVAALSFSVLNGAHVIRVHDVRESADAVRVVGALAAQARCGCAGHKA